MRQTGYGVIAPQKEEDPDGRAADHEAGQPVWGEDPCHLAIRGIRSAPILRQRLPRSSEVKQQAKDLIEYMKQNEQEDGMWNTLIFGKSVEQMIEEGIQSRLSSIGEESQLKLQDTMKRIVNESKGRIICIIL